jgi:outer membrane receptor protein involved in Fe transport
MRAADGRATDGARAARVNVLTSYQVSDGPLKGFTIGGAVRWRAAPTIGYGVTAGPGGETILDLARPFKGRDEVYLDTLVGFRGRLKSLGSVRYRVQLNVRNLFNKDEPVAVASTTTGAIAKIATV